MGKETNRKTIGAEALSIKDKKGAVLNKNSAFSFLVSLKENSLNYFKERLPKRLRKRSTRPPVSSIFCLPVKNG